MALWHRLVKRNHITARYHTAVAFVILSRSLHATKKTTPTAAAAAAAPTAVERNLAEDDVVRGGGCEEEEGAAACPPSPSTPVTSASMKHGGVFLLRRDGSLVGMTVVKHRSAGLECKTRERTVTYSSTTAARTTVGGTVKGNAVKEEGRCLSWYPPRPGAGRQLVGQDDERLRRGGGPDDKDDVSANDKSRWGPLILLSVLPTWTDGTLPPHSATLLATLNKILHD